MQSFITVPVQGGTQLTQLLSSVQASLAELKVEVSSARKLNFDAVLQKTGASSGCVTAEWLKNKSRCLPVR